MAHLLKLVKFDKVKPNILACEFQANKEATPFLVSTSKSLLWINKAPNNVVRAAVRPKTKIHDFYLEILEEITTVGQECLWGNVQPFTKEGFTKAIAYVQSYDLEVECLLTKQDKEEVSQLLKGTDISYSICNWLPKRCVLIVPKDRSYLGFIGVMATGFVSVIQNPSRGIAIVR